MDEALLCEFDQQIHCLVVDFFWVCDAPHFADCVRWEEGHADHVPVGVDWLGDREAFCVKSFHVVILSGGGESAQVKPVVLSSSLKVISVVFDSFEALSSQTSHFQDKFSPCVIFTKEDVWESNETT